MLKGSEIYIDADATMGDKLLLTDINPYYESGDRNKPPIGYKYDIVMLKRRFEKISVKIEGRQLLDAPESSVLVKLTGIEIHPYKTDYGVGLTATATGIAVVDDDDVDFD